jgi:ATP-binding cassette subfamily B protein/subfamily B ATP-binding cassette protein MsbA
MSLLLMLLGPLEMLANSSNELQVHLARFERVLELLEEPEEAGSPPGAIPIRRESVQGRVVLRDVSFRYPEASQDALSHIDLEARPGETVALVGRSGAGKTTLSNLVARFYDPTGGSVELDGRDLRDIRPDSYRKLLGIVEQDVFLFDGTIAENIGYAAPRASLIEIERAAQAAHVHEFVRQMERGYETLIGERGVRLSGGQRQRLAIARALLADPRILIFDEATSNLDSESEQFIQQSLDKLRRGRTCFVIAHRLSTIRRADRIVVLEAGQIVESGSHDALFALHGRYRQMVEVQTLPLPPRVHVA